MTSTVDRPRAACEEFHCPWCGVDPGEKCTTPSGRPLPRLDWHGARWDMLRARYQLPRRYIMKLDEPRFGLKAGDVLICEPYIYDPEKLTVIRREPDGFDPECNVYRGDVVNIPGEEGSVR